MTSKNGESRREGGHLVATFYTRVVSYFIDIFLKTLFLLNKMNKIN